MSDTLGLEANDGRIDGSAMWQLQSNDNSTGIPDTIPDGAANATLPADQLAESRSEEFVFAHQGFSESKAVTMALQVNEREITGKWRGDNDRQ